MSIRRIHRRHRRRRIIKNGVRALDVTELAPNTRRIKLDKIRHYFSFISSQILEVLVTPPSRNVTLAKVSQAHF